MRAHLASPATPHPDIARAYLLLGSLDVIVTSTCRLHPDPEVGLPVLADLIVGADAVGYVETTEDSPGVRAEIDLAQTLGIPTMTIDDLLVVAKVVASPV